MTQAEKIDRIFSDLKNEDITEQQAHEQVSEAVKGKEENNLYKSKKEPKPMEREQDSGNCNWDYLRST